MHFCFFLFFYNSCNPFIQNISAFFLIFMQKGSSFFEEPCSTTRTIISFKLFWRPPGGLKGGLAPLRTCLTLCRTLTGASRHLHTFHIAYAISALLHHRSLFHGVALGCKCQALTDLSNAMPHPHGCSQKNQQLHTVCATTQPLHQTLACRDVVPGYGYNFGADQTKQHQR